jgi:CheY-like chemotaxis protein
MFEPFFSTKDVGKGSGMGLAMVHGIVHDCGGHIQVDSSAAGACFRIWLPAWFPPRQCEQAHPHTAIAGEQPTAADQPLSGRLLLAEDEVSVREFMSDLLTGWGLEVRLTDNGIEACEQFAADPDGFDLVLLDQTMPRMSGLEAAEQLAKLRPAMPLILYTGYSEQVSQARLTAAGVRALLRKPIDIAPFRALLAQLLRGDGAQ